VTGVAGTFGSSYRQTIRMKTPVALLIGIASLIIVGSIGCNTVDMSELPAQEELRAPVPMAPRGGPQKPSMQKGGVIDDSVKPVVQKGGIPDDSIKPVQRGGIPDDSIKPVRITPPPPTPAPR
jgi:hypothetical protein